MVVIPPPRRYALGEAPPALPMQVASWPWGSSSALTKWSLDALKYPLGSILYDVVDGYPVLAQIQTHDRYGAHPEWGIKLHKGTSVFVPVGVDPKTGLTGPLKTPPSGWGVPTDTMAGEFLRSVFRWHKGAQLPGWLAATTGWIAGGLTIGGVVGATVGALASLGANALLKRGFRELA